MSIKPKVGACAEEGCCYVGPLIAGRCQSDYWRHRADVKAAKRKAKEQPGELPIQLGKFFGSLAANMPKFCEETGQRLPTSPDWLKLSCMAHILPKRKRFGFPSVATNTDNIIYLHPDVHTNMDNLGTEYILKMKSLPIMRERVALLLPLLTPEELRRVPDYFL